MRQIKPSIQLRLFCLSLFTFINLSNLAYANKSTFYALEWAGLSMDNNCNSDLKTRNLSISIHDMINSNESPINYSRDIGDFIDKFENPSSGNERSILNFLICDNDVIKSKVYFFNHRSNKLYNERTFVFNTRNIFSLKDSIALAIKEGLYTNGQTNQAVFEACLYPYRIDFLYEEFKTTNYNPEQFTPPYEGGKRPGLSDCIEAIKYYFETKNHLYLKDIVDQTEKKEMYKTSNTKRLKKLRKRYPHLYQLVKGIVVFEEYKLRRAEIRHASQNDVQNKLDDLRTDQDPFTKHELKNYLPHLKHDSLSRNLVRSVALVINCQDVYKIAGDEEKDGQDQKAASIYFEILKNKDITNLILFLKNKSKDVEDEKDCSSIKDDAYRSSNRILNERRKAYLLALQRADELLEEGKCEQAIPFYYEADNINSGLSYYPIYQIQKCKNDGEDYIPNDIASATFIGSDISAIFNQKFGMAMPSTDLLNNVFTTNVQDNKVTFSIVNKEYSVNTFLMETHYRLGSYTSKYSSMSAIKLSEALNDVIRLHGDQIKAINFLYTASADGAGFKVPRLHLKEKSFQVMNDTVCSCNDQDTKHLFQNLARGITAENKSPNIKQRDHNLNSALGYARGKKRRNTIWGKFKHRPAHIKIQESICVNVSKHVGAQYRYVNVEVVIEFRGGLEHFTEQPKKSKK